MRSLSTIVALTFIVGFLSCSAAYAAPVATINVNRGIQFDRIITGGKDGGKAAQHGSRAALLRGPLYLFDPQASMSSYAGANVYVDASATLTAAALEELVGESVRGILVEESTSNAALLAEMLTKFTVSVPVYVIPNPSSENGAAAENMTILSNALRAYAAGQSQNYAVIAIGDNVNVATPTVNETFPGATFFSTVEPRSKEGKRLPLRGAGSPTRVLVSATLDSLGAAPAGKTAGGFSGAAALLELHRQMASRDVSKNSDNSVGFHALWTTGARFNYEGTKTWLGGRSGSDNDQYQLVICLDELLTSQPSFSGSIEDDPLGSSNGLFVHFHDSLRKSEEVQRALSKLKAVAARHNIELTLVPGKADFASYDLRFEHEVFANQRIPAITVSTVRQYHIDQMFRQSLGSGDHNTEQSFLLNEDNVAAYAARVCFLRDAVDSLTQENPTPNTCAADTAAYLSGLLAYAAEAPRSPVTAAHSTFLKTFEGILSRRVQSSRESASAGSEATFPHVTADVKQIQITPSRLMLYGPYTQPMRIFFSHSVLYDLIGSVVAIAIVSAFFSVELGLGKTFTTIRNLSS